MVLYRRLIVIPSFIASNDDAEGKAVNNAGKVVGKSIATPGSNDGNDFRAFFHDGNVMTNLGTLPGGGHSEAVDINEHDQITGSAYIGPISDGDRRGFIYDNGAMTEIPSLGTNTSPNAINESGHLAGSFNDSVFRAFFYDGTNMIDIGRGEAHDLNDLDHVVGTALGFPFVPSNRAFIWDRDNGMRLLNDLIDPLSGWDNLDGAWGINNKGQIVGSGRINRVEHAFLLTPISTLVVPLPATAWIAMPLLGGLGVTRLVRRKTS